MRAMNGKLIVSEGGRERVHELLDDITIVGRGDRADLRLKDEKAAPAHCEIRRTPHGFKVVDLESREGTKINGAFVNSHWLKQGDTLAIGGVEITYLGDSAEPAGKPAPAAPKAPLREIPRDEKGEPKRYYRHESKPVRKDDAGMRALIFLGSLVVIGAIWLSLSNKHGSEKNKAKFVEAVELSRNMDSEERARRILKLLEEIEPGTIDARDVGRVRQEAKEALEGFSRTATAQREYAAWNELAELYKTRPEAADEILGKAEQFIVEYPQSSKIADVQRMKRRVVLGADPERAWDDLTRAVYDASTQKRWKDAFDAFAKLESNQPLRKELGARVDSNRRMLEEKYTGYVTERFKTAQEAASRGDPETAKKIYGEIVAIGVAPHAETAKRALGALK